MFTSHSKPALFYCSAHNQKTCFLNQVAGVKFEMNKTMFWSLVKVLLLFPATALFKNALHCGTKKMVTEIVPNN